MLVYGSVCVSARTRRKKNDGIYVNGTQTGTFLYFMQLF